MFLFIVSGQILSLSGKVRHLLPDQTEKKTVIRNEVRKNEAAYQNDIVLFTSE